MGLKDEIYYEKSQPKYLDMTQKEHLLQRLEFQHLPIEWMVNSLPTERLALKPAPEKWSLHDLLAHLAKYQPEFIDRIHRILHDDEPMFKRYRAEEDPDFEEWRNWSTNTLIKRLKEDRQRIFELITNLSEVKLKRKGAHIKFGLMDILEWVDFFLWHEAHHIFVMYQLAHDVDLVSKGNT